MAYQKTTPHIPNLEQYTQLLPLNYNFELPKIIANITRNKAKCVALQFPDGLLKFSIIIIDCIRHYTFVETILLGDVVYGACNIDDKMAYLLGADMLIHFGHSCLIPITECKIKIMYVFVSIVFDVKHCCKMVEKVGKELYEQVNKSVESDKEREIVNKDNEEKDINNKLEDLKLDVKNREANKGLSLCKQISNNLDECECKNLNGIKKEIPVKTKISIKEEMFDAINSNINMYSSNKQEIVKYNDETLKFIEKNVAIIGTVQFNNAIFQVSQQFNVNIPQIKPLSPGEILGCTSPRIKKPVVIYISDGRFHLESAMIQNPNSIFYKYCPFSKIMSREIYNYNKMIETRKAEKIKAMNCKNIGIILSTLGRQGNPKIFYNLVAFFESKNFKVYKLALKEINQNILDFYTDIECFVQVGCPRLSIDWGSDYKKPLLNAYEVFNTLDEYNMDYYGREENNLWNNA